MLTTEESETEDGWLGKVREIKTRIDKMSATLDTSIERTEKHFEKIDHELVKINESVHERVSGLSKQMKNLEVLLTKKSLLNFGQA